MHGNNLTKSDWKTMKRALAYLKPYKRNISFVILCLLLSSGLNVVQPLLGKAIMDQGLIAKNIAIVFKFAIMILFLVIIDQSISLLETKYLAGLSARYSYDLFRVAFRKMLNLQTDFFTKKNYAEITNTITVDVNNVSKITDKTTFLIVGQVFKVASGIAGLCIINWKLGLIVLGVAPIKYGIVRFLTAMRKRTFREYLDQSRDFYGWFGDVVSGIREIKLWGLQHIQIGKFVRKQKKIINSNIRLAYVDSYNQTSETILYQLLTCLLYIIGAIYICGGTFTVGGLFAFITYSVYVTGPISLITNLIYNCANIIPSAKRLFEFFDMQTENTAQIAKESSVIKQNVFPMYKEGNDNTLIRFSNVKFAYAANRPVLRNVSFTVDTGEKIAITGANGAGKSTIINLLLRFYQPDSGTITFGGKEIQDIQLADYRNLFAVVSQEPYLFNTTIRENIDLKGKCSDKLLMEACKKSATNDFIERLPKKFDTMVGRNGTRLSGGERQKVSVARVFVRDSPVILFDEATSNFDSFSDGYLNEVIFNELRDRTVLFITHKTSILHSMDRVFRLENGMIFEAERCSKKIDL